MPQTRPAESRRARLRGAARAALAALAVLGGTAAGAPAAETAPLPRPAAPAQSDADPAAAADLFAMPRVVEEIRTALGLFEAGDPAAAAAVDRLIRRHPRIGALRTTRAAMAMLEGDLETARAALEAAAAAGAPDLDQLLAEPLFAPLAVDAGLAARLAARPAPPPSPQPAPVARGRALVSAANTAWNPETERLEPRFAFADRPDGPVLPPAPRTAAHELLREHARRGRAAGNHGDLYDNRDRGHSALAPAAHPQLAHVVYSPAAQAADVDYGLADRALFEGVVLGNSSTAITGGALWRSLPRAALTRADGAGPLRLWQNAAANHLYVYPAHKDFGDEGGDLFPANTPYILVSRGSSGSDRPFLEAIAMILAAYRPDTKARLIETGLVVPATQMVFRRSLQNVRSRDSYFSGDAHPAAFEGYQINLARMVSLAQSIRPDEIPAEARIRVVEETLGTEGVDFFGPGLSEAFFDTPAAVARIWRSRAGRRHMIVSAEDSRDANGRPLSFHWRLLQGDPERVTIEPLEDGRRARVTLDWHDPFPISEENPVETARVDVGLFVHNGVHDSAPAILSWHFPAHEARRYEPGPDGAPRLASLDHAARPKAYADPLLLPRADWRDDFAYDDAGALAGWTRRRAGDATGAATGFTAEGARVLARDAEGRPAEVEPVAYGLARGPGGALVLEERPAGAP